MGVTELATGENVQVSEWRATSPRALGRVTWVDNASTAQPTCNDLVTLGHKRVTGRGVSPPDTLQSRQSRSPGAGARERGPTLLEELIQTLAGDPTRDDCVPGRLMTDVDGAALRFEVQALEAWRVVEEPNRKASPRYQP